MSETKTDNRTALARVEPAPVGVLALEPRNIQEGMLLAATAARTKLFGVTSPDDAFVRMATGMALGLSAWQSLRGIFVISGKVGLAADLMLALCLSSPECEYFRCTETTAERATFEAKRRSDVQPMVLTFTMADAKAAGLTGNSMYTKYPANMLRARAIAFLARLMFPERMHGILTREEIDGIEEERGREPAILVQPELPTGDRHARPSPPPDPMRDALRRWDAADATDADIALLESSAEPRHRALVFSWRIRIAESLADLAAVQQDIARDGHAEMRADMLVAVEKRGEELARLAAA